MKASFQTLRGSLKVISHILHTYHHPGSCWHTNHLSINFIYYLCTATVPIAVWLIIFCILCTIFIVLLSNYLSNTIVFMSMFYTFMECISSFQENLKKNLKTGQKLISTVTGNITISEVYIVTMHHVALSFPALKWP